MSRSVIRAVVSVAGASMLAAGVSFIVNIISARSLGPELRGHVATVLQLAYITAPIIGYGVDRALLRQEEGVGPEGSGPEASGHEGLSQQGPRYVLPSLGAVLIALAVVAAIIWPIYGPWIMMAAPAALVTVWMSWYRSDAIRTQKLRGFLIATFGYQGSILIGSLILWLLGVRTWQYWAGVYIIPGIFFALYGFMVVRRNQALPQGGLRESIRNNAALTWSGLAKLISTRLNRILLPAMVSAGSLGLFIVVATATEPLYWIAQSLADYQTSHSGKGNSRDRRAAARSLAKGSLLFLPLGVVGGAVLWFLLVPLFGQAYEPARAFIIPLTIASILLAMFRHLCGILLAGPHSQKLGVAEGAAAVAAMIIFPIVIYTHGALGAAWGSIAVYLIGVIAGYVLLPARNENS